MKNITRLRTVFFQAGLLTTILFGASSCSNDKKPEDTKNIAEEHNNAKFDNTKIENDAQFLVNAAEINLKEISLGQLAQQNSSMADVKEMGKSMEETHNKSQNELIALAKKKLITVPTALTDNAQDAYKKLNNKSGADFDKDYCDMMVKGHKDAIDVFEKASTKSNDGDIREWAIASLPNLRRHLDNAITCQKKCEKM